MFYYPQEKLEVYFLILNWSFFKNNITTVAFAYNQLSTMCGKSWQKPFLKENLENVGKHGEIWKF